MSSTIVPAGTTAASGATTRRWPLTGGLLVASGVLALAGAAILSTAFGWPGVLGDPGSAVLPRFADHETAARAGFTLMLVSSLLLVPAAYGIEAALARPTAAARAVTTFGVAGALFQVLGWVRWPLTVPFLSAAYTDPAASPTRKEAVAASYDVLNRYAGTAVGEFLGWLFQGVWAVAVAVLVLRAVGLPRWFGGLGLALAGVWAIVIPVAGLLRLPGLNSAGQPVYSLWFVWLLALGVLLLRRPVAAGDRTAT